MEERDSPQLLMMLLLLIPPPLYHTEELKDLLDFIFTVVNIPPVMYGIRIRHFADDMNEYGGRDVYIALAANRYQFYQLTGETPETFLELQRYLSLDVERAVSLTPTNRTLLFVIWVRKYPTYHMLASMFNVSVAAVGSVITRLLSKFYNSFRSFIQWPTINEWHEMSGVWAKLPIAVGAIDGTSHRVYRPGTEPQELYYSGHRHYHCIHSQLIVDVYGTIRYIETGYRGHLNDAQQFGLMRQVGLDLPFPDELVLLGDKIYPNRGAVMTPYTTAQLLRKSRGERLKCRKLNRRITQYRVRVEQTIAELKTYRCINSVWRQSRQMLSMVVHVCASLVCRRKQLQLIM